MQEHNRVQEHKRVQEGAEVQEGARAPFDCLTKMSPVVKVASKTIKNLARYFRVCITTDET